MLRSGVAVLMAAAIGMSLPPAVLAEGKAKALGKQIGPCVSECVKSGMKGDECTALCKGRGERGDTGDWCFSDGHCETLFCSPSNSCEYAPKGSECTIGRTACEKGLVCRNDGTGHIQCLDPLP